MSAFIQHWPVGENKKKHPTQVAIKHTNGAFDCNKNNNKENDGGGKKKKKVHDLVCFLPVRWWKKTKKKKSLTIQCLLEMNWTAVVNKIVQEDG